MLSPNHHQSTTMTVDGWKFKCFTTRPSITHLQSAYWWIALWKQRQKQWHYWQRDNSKRWSKHVDRQPAWAIINYHEEHSSMFFPKLSFCQQKILQCGAPPLYLMKKACCSCMVAIVCNHQAVAFITRRYGYLIPLDDDWIMIPSVTTLCWSKQLILSHYPPRPQKHN